MISLKKWSRKFKYEKRIIKTYYNVTFPKLKWFVGNNEITS